MASLILQLLASMLSGIYWLVALSLWDSTRGLAEGGGTSLLPSVLILLLALALYAAVVRGWIGWRGKRLRAERA